MTRTFVALMIPSEWAEYLGGVSRGLGGHMSGLSWVKPENLHLTVRFLGDLGDSGVRRVCDSVTRSAGAKRAPWASLGGLGAFPSLDRPRVLWVGLAVGADEASEVAGAINDALRKDGFGSPDRPFRPHLTLARVRERAEGLDALRSARVPPPPGPASLDRICVMKSELHPAGARYTALTEIRLRPPGDSAPTPPRGGTSMES